MWTTDNLGNESDVEQKFLYQFLVEPRPLGLGLPAAVIQTKANIRRFSIGKGSDQKLYFPDYLVVSMGFPLLVVEAKAPGEAVEEGYREARLYSQELNALFPHGVSPAQLVVACNGVQIWYGHSDHVEPIGKAECKSLGPYSKEIAQLIELMSWERLNARAIGFAQSRRPNDLFKPRRMLGGIGIQNEEVAQNSFGATVTAAISPIFNPTSREERAFIAKNAYISSKRRERYVDPIDRIIRAARPPSETQSLVIEDTARPVEVIRKLEKSKNLEHKVLLLIGSVGSGKSTFVDHLQEVALPKELMEGTVWCRINMNAAPVSSAEIYSWLRREIIDECKRSLPDVDFDDLDILRKVYSVEINKFNKSIGKLIQNQSGVYNLKLAEHLGELQRDQQAVVHSHVRFVCGDRGRLLVIVLDNCDKKTRDEQLLMFEVAQWLQKEFRCLVVLPLRDETYDNHRDKPPLDTALKDLVFRIEPPLFQQVLISRVQLALKSLDGSGNEKLRFSLPNGMTVEYPRSDQAFYLSAIVRSLFEHDRFIRRMIVGLSGRNMRRALEIFLEFCNSGHIGEDQIFKMRQSEGQYTLPFYQVATVLLRMNRRFYDSDASYIKNVFAARKDDAVPAFFCRYMILQWLRERFSATGTSGLKGYFPKRMIKQDLVPYGLSPEVLDREFNYLLAAQCVIAEHLKLDSVEDDDLVRLGPAGFVHLEMVENVNYLAAVAEDTLFADRPQAERVVARIKSSTSHLHIKSVIENAEEVLNYLESVQRTLSPPNGSYMQQDLSKVLTDLSEAKGALLRVKRTQSADPWFDADKSLPRDSVHQVTVTNVVEFGCFVEFGNGLVGLSHRNNMGALVPGPGDLVSVKVLWVDTIQRRMGLQLLSIDEEEFGDQIPLLT